MGTVIQYKQMHSSLKPSPYHIQASTCNNKNDCKKRHHKLERGSSSNESPLSKTKSDFLNSSPNQNMIPNKGIIGECIKYRVSDIQEQRNTKECQKKNDNNKSKVQNINRVNQTLYEFDQSNLPANSFSHTVQNNIQFQENTELMEDQRIFLQQGLIPLKQNQDSYVMFDNKSNRLIQLSKDQIQKFKFDLDESKRIRDGIQEVNQNCRDVLINSDQNQDILMKQNFGQNHYSSQIQNQINQSQVFEQEKILAMMNNSQQNKLSQENQEETLRQERLWEQQHQNQGYRVQMQPQYFEHGQGGNLIQNAYFNSFGQQQNQQHQQMGERIFRVNEAQIQHQFNHQQNLEKMKFNGDQSRIDPNMLSQQNEPQPNYQSIFYQPNCFYNYDHMQNNFIHNSDNNESYNRYEEQQSLSNQRLVGNQGMMKQILTPNQYQQFYPDRAYLQTPQKSLFSQNHAQEGNEIDSNNLIPQEMDNKKIPQTTTIAGNRKFSDDHFTLGAHQTNYDYQQQSIYGQKVLYEKSHYETESYNKFCEIQNPSESSSIQNQQQNYLIDFVLNEGDEENEHIQEKLLDQKIQKQNSESVKDEILTAENNQNYIPLQMNPRGSNSLDRIGQNQSINEPVSIYNSLLTLQENNNRNHYFNFQQQQQPNQMIQQQPRYFLQQNQVFFRPQNNQQQLVHMNGINQLNNIDYQNDIEQLQQTKLQIQNKIEDLQRAQSQNYDQRNLENSNYLKDQNWHNQYDHRELKRVEGQPGAPRNIPQYQQEYDHIKAINRSQGVHQENIIINEKISQIGGQRGIKANHQYGQQNLLNNEHIGDSKALNNQNNSQHKNSANQIKKRSSQKKACSEKNSPYTSQSRKLQQQKHETFINSGSYQKSSEDEDIQIDLKLNLKPFIPQEQSNMGRLESQSQIPKKKNSEAYSTSNIHRDELGPLSDVFFDDIKSPGKSSQSRNSNEKKYQAQHAQSKGSKTQSDSKNKSGSDSNQGGHYGSSKSSKQNDQNSNLAFDKFMQQIQTDIKNANEDPDKEFKVLDGHIMYLATKKIGSKFLQDHLKKAKQTLINKIQQQIEGHLPELMMDNYGNYFCSQLIENLQVHQRIRFLKQIKGQKFIEISCNNRGTYALQNIIQLVTQEEEFDLIKETLIQDDNICKLAKDIQGQHMIQKIIKSFKENRRDYIFQKICQQFKELATDKQGLCVMKVLIQNTNKPENREIIVDKITEDGLEYVQNEYGNFVVSEALTYFKYEHTKKIFEQMKSHFSKLSQNKFASKFIEICIDKAPKNIQNEICKEFCHSPYLYKVIQSKFGNFVLQKSIKTFQDPELIECTINSLSEVTQYQVQQKWGTDLLVKFIGDLPKKDRERLNDILDEKMILINEKFKQHQSSESHNSNNHYGYSSNKAYVSSHGNKSSYSSNHTGQSYYNNYLNDQSSGSGRGGNKLNSENSYKNEDPYYASNQQSQRKVINNQQSNTNKKPVRVVRKNDIKFANNQQSKKSGSGSEKEKDFNQ